MLQPRLAEVDLGVDHAGQDVQSAAVERLGALIEDTADPGDAAVADADVIARAVPSWLTTVPPRSTKS